MSNLRSKSNLFLAILAAGGLSFFGVANAADGCGPGCHGSQSGACVIDGWGATRARNECPAGAHPRPPCGPYYSYRYGACFPK
jgi:hypothetical protein